MSDTIFALASAPGRGGVAVVRMSGPFSYDLVMSICGGLRPEPRTAYFRKIIDPVSRETIDRGLVIFFQGPASFTGEDVAEFHLHGSMAAVRRLLDVLAAQPGCRMAAPGEFTRRAFENGKLDLTEAEAVADLIDAETDLQRAQALSQLEGSLSRLYDGWRESLTRMLAHLEADLEFPDEDLPDGVSPQIIPQLQDVLSTIRVHLQDGHRGERLRDGIHVAVIGAPNAGKSSLVNALARRDVAIVSEHAGTTRDVIEVALDLKGYPVVLADTAGLRPGQLAADAQGAIEEEGIRRALRRAREADIRVLVFDGALLPELDTHTAALNDGTALVVFNKCDGGPVDVPVDGAVCVSAQTGAGLDDLTAALAALAESLIGRRETPSLTRRRHREALEACAEALARALEAPLPELMAEDVRLAVRELGRITGRVDIEEMLDVIFRDFCIGK